MYMKYPQNKKKLQVERELPEEPVDFADTLLWSRRLGQLFADDRKEVGQETRLAEHESDPDFELFGAHEVRV